MRSTLEYIADYLENQVIRYMIRQPEKAMVTSVQPLDERMQFSDTVLYVVYESKYAEFIASDREAPTNIACILEKERSFLPFSDAEWAPNIILLTFDASLFLISRACSDVMASYLNFHTRLDKLLLDLDRGQGFQAISDCIYECTGLSTSITDFSGKVLSVNSQYKPPTSFLETTNRDRFISRNDNNLLDRFHGRERIGEAMTSHSAVLSHYPAPGEPENGAQEYFLDMMISVGNTTAAMLGAVAQSKPIPRISADMFNVFGSLIAAEFRKAHSETDFTGQRISSSAFLWDLLTGGILDQEVMWKRCVSLGIPQRKTYAVLNIRSTSSIAPVPAHAVKKNLLSYFPAAPAIEYGNNLVILLCMDSLTDAILPPDSAREFFRYMANESLYAGISNCTSDLMTIKRNYEQASWAVSFGLIFPSDKRIYYYRDCTTYHVLEIMSQTHDILEFADPKLIALSNSGNPEDAELLDTLYLYFSYSRDINRASDELNIHRNTLYYRLNKLKTYLDIPDYNDGNVVFSLMWSLMIIRYARGKKNNFLMADAKHLSKIDNA